MVCLFKEFFLKDWCFISEICYFHDLTFVNSHLEFESHWTWIYLELEALVALETLNYMGNLLDQLVWQGSDVSLRLIGKSFLIPKNILWFYSYLCCCSIGKIIVKRILQLFQNLEYLYIWWTKIRFSEYFLFRITEYIMYLLFLSMSIMVSLYVKIVIKWVKLSSFCWDFFFFFFFSFSLNALSL
mgnify:CR=1 FL=1